MLGAHQYIRQLSSNPRAATKIRYLPNFGVGVGVGTWCWCWRHKSGAIPLLLLLLLLVPEQRGKYLIYWLAPTNIVAAAKLLVPEPTTRGKYPLLLLVLVPGVGVGAIKAVLVPTPCCWYRNSGVGALLGGRF